MVSNTLAGSSNQTYFCPPDANKAYTGRVFYRVFAGGEYDYAFLFSGKTDSSFPIENISPCDTPVVGWTIVEAKVGICATCTPTAMPEEIVFQSLSFDGKREKQVETPELFWSDCITLAPKKGEYLCLEITYRGEKIPHHYENTIPAFRKAEEGWIADNRVVFANMVGCNRTVRKKIAFFGDSITQGIGAPCNSYLHWNARLAEKLGEEYAFWNLGIGYGMGNDGAKGGVWLEKAKQNDIVFVCFGVNDIFRVREEQTIKRALLTILQELKKGGCKVAIQTIPPFDYDEANVRIWKHLNTYIQEELKEYADLVLVPQPLLEKEGVEGGAKYGGHPNAEGCRVWAEGIFPAVKEWLDTIQ